MLKKLRFTLLLALLFFSFPLSLLAGSKNYRYEIALVAIFKDEAPYLKEWIEFHRTVGVDHFYLFNNYSEDNYLEVLSPYLETSIVTLIDWGRPNSNLKEWAQTQFSAYEKGVEMAKGVAKWVVVIDTDEFLFPAQKYSLKEALRPFENYGAVVVNWQMYGTSDIEKIPDSEPISAYLLYKAPFNHHLNRNVKSIVRPESVKSCSNPHFFNLHAGYTQVDPHGRKCFGQLNSKISNDVLRINHYWTRDLDYFYNKKLPRHYIWGENMDTAIKTMKELSVEYDGAILRYMNELRDRLELSI